MTNTPKKVLIAVDGTDRDRSVVRQALDLFGDDADYVVISVCPEPAAMGAASVSYATASAFSAPSLSHFADGLDADAHEAEDVAERTADEAGMSDAETVGEVGNPATVLLQQAADSEVDVLVIGASERNWFSRLFEPSVEASVLNRATCPVLVVHPI
ncbi:MAG: nucleotide-binding universal stress UspA family protein [Ilumatobacter sp.]|jgi:nucleotide-binding universal stress UspA family protein